MVGVKLDTFLEGRHSSDLSRAPQSQFSTLNISRICAFSVLITIRKLISKV